MTYFCAVVEMIIRNIKLRLIECFQLFVDVHRCEKKKNMWWHVDSISTSIPEEKDACSHSVDACSDSLYYFKTNFFKRTLCINRSSQIHAISTFGSTNIKFKVISTPNNTIFTDC